MRRLAFILIMQASLCIAQGPQQTQPALAGVEARSAFAGAVDSPRCPDPRLRQARIGGDTITGIVLLHNQPVTLALVWLYSASGTPVWVGITDKNGGFVIDKLPPARYRLEVHGWGTTSVELDPSLDKTFNGQMPAWGISLMDNECVGVWMNMN